MVSVSAAIYSGSERHKADWFLNRVLNLTLISPVRISSPSLKIDSLRTQ
jgi:hypothetical protein